MKKVIIQGLFLIVSFFATWFIVMQVNWMKFLKVQKITDKTEMKLGELFWEVFKKTEKEDNNPFVVNSVDSIATRICSANNIDRKSIKIHILYNDDVNAFALPNGHLVIYSSLIQNAENPEELAGVISHEIAHIQLNHVMKMLVKEVGLTMLISITTGKGSSESIKQVAKKLSSSAFDRRLEKEADLKAIDYLVNARIDPEPFANFLYRLSNKENNEAKYLKWISTHPESKERAAYIIEYFKGKKINHERLLTGETWNKLKDKLGKR